MLISLKLYKIYETNLRTDTKINEIYALKPILKLNKFSIFY
jgi:hypothetical protein